MCHLRTWKEPLWFLPFDSSHCSLQVGAGRHDHQQQHQQAHLLLPRLTLLKAKQNQNSSHCFRTLGFYLSNQLKLQWTVFEEPGAEIVWFKWKLRPKFPECDFLRRTSLKDILTLETTVIWDRNYWHLLLFFLASLEIQSAYDNHRLLILSTGRDDKNFSQRSWELTSLLRMSHSTDLY